KLWARNGEAVRQAIELGELVHLETASKELTDEFQIPSDLVVKLRPLILLKLFHTYPDTQTLFKRYGETGNHRVSCFHHLRLIGPPLNSMECEISFSNVCAEGDLE